MQSGRVLPIIRQFFTNPISTKSATDPHSGNQNKQGRQEREPKEDEAKEAFELLLEQEEFKLQGLNAELKFTDGRYSIVVTDKLGHTLRTIKGPGIIAILETSSLGKSGHFRGRILDRRI